MLKSFGIDELETRNINRGFEKIFDEITSSCKKILDNMEVVESRKLVIINSLITAYKDMNISIADFLQMHADEDLNSLKFTARD